LASLKVEYVHLLNRCVNLSHIRQLYSRQQAVNERTDNGFESQIFSRVLISISSDWFPLLHPFPVISLASHLVMVDDVVALRVGDFDVGVIGKIITLNGGLFQNRCLLESKFFVKCLLYQAGNQGFPAFSASTK